MCKADAKCEKPEELKDVPEACSPEQVKKCHGDGKGHPCVAPDDRRTERFGSRT